MPEEEININKNHQEVDRFLKSLKYYRLTVAQRKTLRGQVLAGDLAGARRGLAQILKKAE